MSSKKSTNKSNNKSNNNKKGVINTEETKENIIVKEPKKNIVKKSEKNISAKKSEKKSLKTIKKSDDSAESDDSDSSNSDSDDELDNNSDEDNDEDNGEGDGKGEGEGECEDNVEDEDIVEDDDNVIVNKNDDIKIDVDVKEKKEKQTFESIVKDIRDLRSQIVINNDKIKELKKDIKEFDKSSMICEKQINKLLIIIDKAHEDSLNKARKEKKKRTNSARKGILEPLPVPPILAKFLNISETELLPRTTLMSKLNDVFKERNLKDGQKTTLDKKTADELGVETGKVIEFKTIHQFISSYYKKPQDTKINL